MNDKPTIVNATTTTGAAKLDEGELAGISQTYWEQAAIIRWRRHISLVEERAILRGEGTKMS